MDITHYLKQQEGKTLELNENCLTRKILTSELLPSSLHPYPGNRFLKAEICRRHTICHSGRIEKAFCWIFV